MNTLYKQYIEMYGNFSHILNIKIDSRLSKDEKNQILLDIHGIISEKDITKNISNANISVKWRTIDFYHYFTDGNGILSDKGIYAHTKLLLNQRIIKMAHFNYLGSDTSNDLKRSPRRGAVLNLHWYKSSLV